MNCVEVKNRLQNNELDKELCSIYGDEKLLAYQKKRYVDALCKFETYYGEGDVAVFSAPGRSEIGGNHTDHQHGEVLAAAINLDAIAMVRKTEDNKVRVRSGEYPEVVITLEDLSLKTEERETTLSLVKGVLAGFVERGLRIGGFNAYITSDVLVGSGLSSSAAFETLIGTILSGLYNEMNVSPIAIAQIGQYAENVYFGKPCGLMDQMASSVGSMVHIDFKNPKEPIVEKVDCDIEKLGYSLCITDTKGSHADLTHEYAAVPEEMKAVASYFGKEVLQTITVEDILSNIDAIRKKAGDRSVLRALHFINENKRVEREVDALKHDDICEFLKVVKESGDSSYKYLQNVYANSDVEHQNVSLALAISEMFLSENGVCRVHGGGFAGTIQAFVKTEYVCDYKMNMNRIFGENACQDLKIRKHGGIQIV